MLRVGARTFSRTSIAAAVASGLIARCGLLDPSPPSWNDLERTEQAREQSSALLALADQGLVQDYDPAQHGNGILRYPDQAPPPDEG